MESSPDHINWRGEHNKKGMRGMHKNLGDRNNKKYQPRKISFLEFKLESIACIC